MPHGSSDHIPVYPTIGDSNSISPAVPVNEVCKIQVGLVFKTPSELFDAVEQAFLSTGMPASHFIRKAKGSFNDEEQLQHFGSIFRRNGEVVPCPVRGAFRCKKTGKQGGCPWYVQFGHYIKHSGYLITVSCTEHNHPVSEPTIDGYTEIKYEKDLEIDELEVIRSLVFTICPFIAICCLGYTHMIGCSTGLSENSVDITKAAHCFGVSSVEKDIDVSSLFDPPYHSHSHHDFISH